MIGVDPVEVFRQEAAELLDSLEANLLDLSHDAANSELIDAAFRALHTIKGSGAMFGFDRVATFAHDFETAFDLIRKGQIVATTDIIAVALDAKDHIRELIDDPISTDAAVGEAIVRTLNALMGGKSTSNPAADHGQVAHATQPAQEADAHWHLAFRFDPAILHNGTNPLALLDELRSLGLCEITAHADAVPTLDQLDPESCMLRWTAVLRGPCTREAIEDVFVFVRDDMDLSITQGVAKPAHRQADPAPGGADGPVTILPAPDEPIDDKGAERAETPEKSEASRRGDVQTQTVRVQAERLDELMDRVGELVIAQARLSQLANTGSDPAIKAIAEEIERLASSLRDSTMGVRMVPMGTLFGRFRRLIHDLSRDLGKPVSFVTVGEETELDKTMIERLADPLVHLIRNAIDHGIEKPDTRVAAGKEKTGCIQLSAHYSGAQVHVTVQDDGAGLDTARIRAKAEEQGLLQPGAALSDQDIHQFLFHPGFSTAKTVSALSGRGVGMDVVKRTIETMRGTIDVATKRGHGSTMTMRLPLTLAIIDGLLIRVGDSRYIIPLSAIEECIELTPAMAARATGRNFLDVRGELVPFLHLRDQFGADGVADPYQKIIITVVGETRIGLVVDQIIGSHQTVIKSLSKLHTDVTMFSGATILGDGSVALIIDVAQIATAEHQQRDSGKTAEAA